MIQIIPPGRAFQTGFSVCNHVDKDGYSIEELSKLSSEHIKYEYSQLDEIKQCVACRKVVHVDKISLHLGPPINMLYTTPVCENCLLLVNICALCLSVVDKTDLEIWEGRFACRSCLDKIGVLEYDN